MNDNEVVRLAKEILTLPAEDRRRVIELINGMIKGKPPG